jgi:hypothetical protein
MTAHRAVCRGERPRTPTTAAPCASINDFRLAAIVCDAQLCVGNAHLGRLGSVRKPLLRDSLLSAADAMLYQLGIARSTGTLNWAAGERSRMLVTAGARLSHELPRAGGVLSGRLHGIQARGSRIPCIHSPSRAPAAPPEHAVGDSAVTAAHEQPVGTSSYARCG